MASSAVQAHGAASRQAWASFGTWSDDRLRALLERRPDLAVPPPRSLAHLAERAVAGPSTEEAFRRLDRSAQQVVEVLALLADPAPVAEVAALIAPGVTPADLDAPLARLEAAALVHRDGGHVSLNPGTSRLHHRAGLGPPLAGLAAPVPVSELAAACKRLGVPAGRGKAGAVAALTALLADPEQVRRALRKAPAGTADLARRAALGAEVHAPGSIHYLDDRTPAGWLALRGFLAAAGWTRLVMPGEVGLALRGGHVFDEFRPGPPEVPTATVDPGAVDAAGTEQALRLVADVASLLEAWAAEPAKLLKDGGVGVRELRRAARAVERSERETARLVDLAVCAGLVWFHAPTATARPTAAFDTWADLTPHLRWAALVSGWLGAEADPSLAGVTDHRDKVIPALLDEAPDPHAVGRRRSVLDAMASLPRGSAAVATDALAARARWSSPGLWTAGPAPAAMLAGWLVEECELLGVWSHGSLTTAGRLVAGGDVAGAAAALAERAPAPVAELVLLADMTAVAPGPLTPDVARELELMADVESRGAARVFRFGEQSLRRALDAGRSADGIAGFLESHAPRGVPQALAYLVADVGRRHGQVRVGAVRSYLRSDDTALLGELCSARALARLGLRRLAPTVVVTDAEPGAMLAALRSAGYLPVEEDGTGAVVVSRPAAARAPARPAAAPGRPAAPAKVDAAAVVAALRRAPAAPRPAPAAPPAVRPAPAERAAAPPTPVVRAPELFDEDDRPTAIAKDRSAIRVLLDEAYQNEWLVRASYSNAKGAASQLNLLVAGVSDDTVVAEVLPSFNLRTLSLPRVHWARVLTEAEEDQLL